MGPTSKSLFPLIAKYNTALCKKMLAYRASKMLVLQLKIPSGDGKGSHLLGKNGAFREQWLLYYCPTESCLRGLCHGSPKGDGWQAAWSEAIIPLNLPGGGIQSYLPRGQISFFPSWRRVQKRALRLERSACCQLVIFRKRLFYFLAFSRFPFTSASILAESMWITGRETAHLDVQVSFSFSYFIYWWFLLTSLLICFWQIEIVHI